MSLVSEPHRERFLLDALAPIRDHYDLVVVDTPPNLGLLTVNALVCAEVVLAPVSAEDEGSLSGILELRETIRRLAERLGVQPMGILSVLTRWAPLRLSGRGIEHALAESGLAPRTRIPSRSAAITQAAADRVPLAISAPDGAVTLAYHELGAIPDSSQNRSTVTPASGRIISSSWKRNPAHHRASAAATARAPHPTPS